jgi:hypothetical protein
MKNYRNIPEEAIKRLMALKIYLQALYRLLIRARFSSQPVREELLAFHTPGFKVAAT